MYEDRIQKILTEMETMNSHKFKIVEKNRELEAMLEDQRNRYDKMATDYQEHIKDF